MAGSRTEKIGTIFTRMRGLLRSGAIKEVDKPVWYDVYEAFPPQVIPKYERFQEDREPKNILYKEDVTRERFYNTFSTSDAIDMKHHSSVPLCERFIGMYNDLAKSGTHESQIFDKVTEAMRSEGITLKTVEEIQLSKKLAALQARLENEAKRKAQPAESQQSIDMNQLFQKSAGSASDEPDDGLDGENYTDPR